MAFSKAGACRLVFPRTHALCLLDELFHRGERESELLAELVVCPRAFIAHSTRPDKTPPRRLLRVKAPTGNLANGLLWAHWSPFGRLTLALFALSRVRCSCSHRTRAPDWFQRLVEVLEHECESHVPEVRHLRARAAIPQSAECCSRSEF